MSAVPSVRPDRLIRALERAGFFIDHATGGHYVLKHQTRSDLRVVVPHHSGDIKRGVMRAILRQAALTVEDLLRLL
jgi:predicted RNA binding protein YcfA (HicA-like mRNA interferase family)